MLLELKTTRSNWCDILGLVVRDGSGIQEGLGFQDGQWNHQEAIVNLVGCKTLCVICVSGEEMSRSGGSARSGGQRARSISLGTWCSFTLFLASSSNSLLVFVMWSFCFLFFFFSPVRLGFAEMSTPFSPCRVLFLNLDFVSESLSAAQFGQPCSR